MANGYDSETGTAALFIIDLKSGRLIRELDTGYSEGGNGLSTPFPVDIDNDRVFDYVYAGDIQGNLWKFDLTGSDPEGWKVVGVKGIEGQPLFVACANAGRCDDTRRPITAAPDIGAYPSGGVMIYFGTGSFFADADRNDQQKQSFYGIRDRSITVGNVNAVKPNMNIHRRDLLEQAFITPAGGIASAGVDEAGNPGTGAGATVRLASNHAINEDYEGWVIDLPLLGERQVSAPIVSRGRIIFSTQIPNSSPCSAGGTSFLVALDAFSGGRLDFSPFDLNNDNQFDNQDKTIHDGNAYYGSAIQSTVGIVGTPTLITSPEQERAILSGSSGDLQNVMINPGPGGGPQSWRQLR